MRLEEKLKLIEFKVMDEIIVIIKCLSDQISAHYLRSLFWICKVLDLEWEFHDRLTTASKMSVSSIRNKWKNTGDSISKNFGIPKRKPRTFTLNHLDRSELKNNLQTLIKWEQVFAQSVCIQKLNCKI